MANLLLHTTAFSVVKAPCESVIHQEQWPVITCVVFPVTRSNNGHGKLWPQITRTNRTNARQTAIGDDDDAELVEPHVHWMSSKPHLRLHLLQSEANSTHPLSPIYDRFVVVIVDCIHIAAIRAVGAIE